MARPAKLCVVVFGLTISSIGLGAQQSTAPPAQRPAPPCPVSTDPDFGFSAEKPIRVGGGAFTVAAREQRYLNALRGPDDKPVRFRRLGSTATPQRPGGRLGPLDLYEVTYEGLADPIKLYLDVYAFDEPQAPRGFTCVGFGLTPPPVDPFMAIDQTTRLAIEQGAKPEIAPISLDADGKALHGVAFDRFRMIARASRASTEAGKPIDPKQPPRELTSLPLVLLAYPIECGGHKVPAVSIDIAPPQGPLVRRLSLHTGAEAANAVPGFAIPDGTIAAKFGLQALRPNDSVRISYAEDACLTQRETALPVQFVRARPASLPPPSLPAGMTGPQPPVWLQAVIDLEGVFQQAEFLGGPEPLSGPALSTIAGWRAEPARINGTPVVSDTILIVQFK